MSDSTLTLSEALAILTYRDSLSFSTYRTLAEWLGCYHYVLPADRYLNDSALNLPIRSRKPGAILSQYHFTILLETCYTPDQQSNIIREILCYPHKHQLIQDS